MTPRVLLGGRLAPSGAGRHAGLVRPGGGRCHTGDATAYEDEQALAAARGRLRSGCSCSRSPPTTTTAPCGATRDSSTCGCAGRTSRRAPPTGRSSSSGADDADRTEGMATCDESGGPCHLRMPGHHGWTRRPRAGGVLLTPREGLRAASRRSPTSIWTRPRASGTLFRLLGVRERPDRVGRAHRDEVTNRHHGGAARRRRARPGSTRSRRHPRTWYGRPYASRPAERGRHARPRGSAGPQGSAHDRWTARERRNIRWRDRRSASG